MVLRAPAARTRLGELAVVEQGECGGGGGEEVMAVWFREKK